MKKMAMILTIALVFGLGSLTFTQEVPTGDRYADDPYRSWEGGFLDFVPPNSNVIDLLQPDGTRLTALLTPMETGGHLETLDGYTIVQGQQDWWTYAQPGNGVGAAADEAIPTQLVPGRDAPNGLPRKVGQHRSIWVDDQNNDRRDPVFEAVKNVQSPNASIFASQNGITKNYHYVVILAEFQDVKFEPYQTAQFFRNQISGRGASPTGTVSDLYYEMSYGQFLPDFEVVGPFTLPANMYAYDIQLSGGKSVAGMINDLAPQLAALGADWWDRYDNDRVVYTSSGTQYRSVDMVVVLHAGPGKEATGQTGQVWSHATTANLNTGVASDGRQVRIRGVNTVPAIGFNIGVVAHEMGHIIGEADFYDTSYLSMGTGDYDLMAGGSWMGNDPAGSNPTHMNPFSKINQGWVETTKVTDTTLGVELEPRSTKPEIIEIPLGGSGGGTIGAEERLYIEYISNRVPGGIFDKAAYNSGLLIWHYDRGGSMNKPFYRPARYRMEVVEYDFLDGTQELQLNLNRGEPGDVWRDTALGITPYTTPSTDRHTPLISGGSTKTGWYLMNISNVGTTMNFDIVREGDVLKKLGVGRPGLLNQPVLAGSGPAILSAKVYNLTAADLSNVKVKFMAITGQAIAQVAETVLATLPSGAPAIAEATWNFPVAGKWDIEVEVSVDEASASAFGVARVFPGPANVLIIDDDDGYNSEEAFEGVLRSLGVPYVLIEHTAPLALLQQFELVIWSAGQAGRYQGQLNLNEIADLKAYLNAGGKLWIASPRTAAALGSPPTGASSGVNPAFLRDYLGAAYPMSSQNGGGTITGLGQWIGGNASFELRQFPGRAVQDYMDPAFSAIGSVTPLFTWSYGHHLGIEVVGDAEHNKFHVVYFGFNLSQMIDGSDRLTLTQQVLDRMDIASVYFDKTTYLIQKSGAAKVTVHDPEATAPLVRVNSDGQPEGVTVALVPADVAGTFAGVLSVQKTGSSGGALKVNSIDRLTVVYEDSPGYELRATADVLSKKDIDQPATIYHDLIYIATDAQNLPVMAVVTDDIRVQKAELYYRMASTVAYSMLPMEVTARDAYTAFIPASMVTPLGVEYFIVARDSKNTLTFVATAASPNFIVVQPRTLGLE